MDLNQKLGGAASELFEAQAHIYRHILNYTNSMALCCALELGIPDIIHDHQKPITLEELVSKLNISHEKTLHLQRLMTLLIHSNFFSLTKFYDQENKHEKEGYVLTLSSKLLLNNSSEKSPNLPSLLPVVNLLIDPVYVTTWQFLGRWFNRNESTAFETAHGCSMWELAINNPRFNKLFNDAMASNSEMMKLVVNDNRKIFEGVELLVDVGGGNGANAKILHEAFPHLKCTVFDLPHVVVDMVNTMNLTYVGGDMFSSIPSGDAIVLKNILHDWSDEEVVKILERCKEAIPFAHSDHGKKRKIIIIDLVIDENQDQNQDDRAVSKLIFGIKMMLFTTGKERTKDEWEKLFFQAKFNQYQITHTSGLMSIIELFP